MRHVLLWVARHGETDWNRARRIQGHIDVELNATGRDQAADLAHELHQELRGLGGRPPALVASDLRRASQTARAVAQRLGLSPLHTRRDLRERGFGAVEGRTWDELRRSHPAEVEAYKSRADRDAIPGSEPLAAFRQRVLRGLGAVAAEAERAIVVTHGGVLRVLLEEALGEDKQFMIGNAAVYRFRWRAGELERVVRFEGAPR